MCFLAFVLSLATPHYVFRLSPSVSHPTSAMVFPCFLSNSLLPLSRSPAIRVPHPTLYYRPPTFVYPFHSRTLVFPSCTSYQTPRILRVTRLGPPEKVDSVNRAHGDRACPSMFSFAPPLSNSSESPLLLSPSILLSRHTTIPCTHPPSCFLRFHVYTPCLCAPFVNPHAFFSALHLVPRF